MCSVLGMYDPNAAMEDGREELMRELSARMRTRGPDGSGYYAVSYTHLTLPTNREV